MRKINFKRIIILLLVVILLLGSLLSGCTGNNNNDSKNVVYVDMKETFDKAGVLSSNLGF